MKKNLLAGVALVALTLSGTAYASTPIKLELGGRSMWLFGVATQDSGFKQGKDYSSTDVKGNNYVSISGDTTLDNGMKVGFYSSFRAGGNSNTQHNADPLEYSWVYAEGRYGKLLVGTNDNPAYILHVSAPDAAGLSEDAGLGLLSGRWVVVPKGFYHQWTTAIDATGCADRIMYFTPKMSGFTLAAGFTPGTGDYVQGNRDLGVANETYTAGLNYTGVFSEKLSLSASLGWQGGQGLHASTGAFGNQSGRNIDTYNDFSGGLRVGYNSFTVGGAVRFLESKTKGNDDKVENLVWIVGIQYDLNEKVAPLSVSLNYFNSTAKFKPVDDRDRAQNINLSLKYQLGDGVRWIGSLGYMKFDSDRSSVESNKGMVVLTGLAMNF